MKLCFPWNNSSVGIRTKIILKTLLTFVEDGVNVIFWVSTLSKLISDDGFVDQE